MNTRPPSLQELRDETARQLDDLQQRHSGARRQGEGWTGLSADIESLARALVALDRRLDEKRGKRPC